VSAPITAAEMAVILGRTINATLAGICDAPDGESFELTAPATGQRFRVTVAEVSPWSDQVDRELREVTREDGTR
jgi:hypothetical protein